MFQKTILFIALRYILRKTTDQFSKYIYWIASIAIMLSMIILITVLSVMNGFEKNLKQNLLYFTPHVFLTTVKGYVHIKDISKLICDGIFYNIEYIQPLIVSNVILQSAKKISIGSMLGVDPNYFEPLSDYLINHRISQLVSGKYYIVLGSTLARYLEVNIHDQIRLIIPNIMQITPFGCFPSQRLFIVSDIYETNRDIDDYQVLVHQLDASKLMRYPSEYYITGWRLWLHDPFIIDNFNRLLSNHWVWKDWKEDKGSLFQAIKMEKNVMSLLLGLIIVASCFNVMSFLVLLIIEKQKEIAILQTYGFTRFQIMLLFMIQGISNGIFGTVFGIGLGILLSKKLNQILSFLNVLPNTLQFPVEIQNFQILVITVITFLVIILVTIYPSWYATSIPVAKVLRFG